MTGNPAMDSLDSIGSVIDLKKVPSIHQKRLLAFVNHFIVTTVKFLNNFAQTCESKLMSCDLKIQRLEAELCILEAKFSSIPDLEDLETKLPEELPQPIPAADEPDEPSGEATDAAVLVETADESDQPQPPATEGETPLPEKSPELAKYFKMVHVGVPIPAVKSKMQQDGFDPNLLGS